MGAKSRRPLDLSLPPEVLEAAMAAGVDQPYGNAAAAMDLGGGASGLRGFDLPDGESCFGADVGESATVGVCGGVDPDLDPSRPDDPNQKKGARASLGVNLRF